MIDVKGKWCLVTGGCRGVGRLIAIEMAKLGANLILQGRDKSHAEKVIAELTPYGVQVKAVGCNLENEVEIDAAFGGELLCSDEDCLPLFAGHDQARFWTYAAYHERHCQ